MTFNLNKKFLKLSNKGTTLAEALITVSIFSLGALSLINLQSKVIRANSFLFQNGQAMTLANDKLEELRNYIDNTGYSSIASGNDVVVEFTTSYSRNWTVTDMSNPTYKHILVEVSWQKRDGSTDSKRVTTNIGYTNPILNAAAMASSTQKVTTFSELVQVNSSLQSKGKSGLAKKKNKI